MSLVVQVCDVPKTAWVVWRFVNEVYFGRSATSIFGNITVKPRRDHTNCGSVIHMYLSKPSSMHMTQHLFIKISNVVFCSRDDGCGWHPDLRVIIAPKLCYQADSSTLPSGTPAELLRRRAKNCIIGYISSRLLGIVSPDLRYRLNWTDSNTALSLFSADEVTHGLSLPEQTRIGVLRFGDKEAAASLGRGPPTLITPPSSFSILTEICVKSVQV